VNKRLLYLVLIAFAGLLLIFGLSFPRAVQAVILPVATAAWLLLRFFVLSVDQEVYWWGLISLVVIVILGRLALGAKTQGKPSMDQYTASALSRDRADYWRSSILLNAHSAGERDLFRRDLMWLFTSMHASRREGNENYKIREAIQKREIPVPEYVHSFFFPMLPGAPERPYWRHPISWLKHIFRPRRRPGRKKSQYFDSIDEVLSYLETSLEMNDDE
jgi:hypothetical protein